MLSSREAFTAPAPTTTKGRSMPPSRVRFTTLVGAGACLLASAAMAHAAGPAFMLRAQVYPEGGPALITRVVDRPERMTFFSGRTENRIGGMRWSGWGSGVARASATNRQCVSGACVSGRTRVTLDRLVTLRCGATGAVSGRFYSRMAYLDGGVRVRASMPPVCAGPQVRKVSVAPSGPGELYARTQFCDLRRPPVLARFTITWELLDAATGTAIETSSSSAQGYPSCLEANATFFQSLTGAYRLRVTIRNRGTRLTGPPATSTATTGNPG